MSPEATKRLRVLIADDEPLGRERVAALLAAHDDIEIVAAVDDGAKAVEAIKAGKVSDLDSLEQLRKKIDG